ncbi:MAG TPA: GNAT family N-acetyltransferase [Thermoanaerobaculia bacterium]|jgi:predicted acetyltransferase
MAIELVNARHSPEARHWLHNVYPFYLHDLSEFQRDIYLLSDEGRWEPDHLPSWFTEAGAYPFVICDDGVRVGFALVGKRPFPWRSPEADQRLGEFFILRSHRGNGVGSRAALEVFKMFSGVWELYELPLNQGAIRFWRRVIASLGEYGEESTPDFLRQWFRMEGS